MLPRHVSLALPLSLLWLLCQFCFLSDVLWRELGGLGSRESCSLDCLSVATTLQTQCPGLQLGSAESCHLFSCCFPAVPLSLATCCDPAVACGMGAVPHPGVASAAGSGQDWGPAATCQCSGPLGLFWSFVPCISLKPGCWKLWVSKVLCQTAFPALLFPERLQAGEIVL